MNLNPESKKNQADRDLYNLVISETPCPEFFRLVAEFTKRFSNGDKSLTQETDGPSEMDQTETWAFEKTTMPYGKFRDLQTKDMPVDYFEAVAGGVSFARKLNRYLKRVT